MSSLANTRKFSGTQIKVDDLAASFVTHSGMMSVSKTVDDATIIATTKASSTIADEADVILQGLGTWTLDFFDDMNDLFLAEMKEMLAAQSIRSFKLVIAEGTKDTCTFNAYVSNIPVTGGKKDKYRMTLTLRQVGAGAWAAT